MRLKAVAKSAATEVSRVPVSHVPRAENLSFLAPEVERALDLADQCAAAEAKMPGQALDSVWQGVAKLRPVLLLTLQPEFELPPCFQQAMDTCVSCLLHVPEGQLQCVGRMADLLELPDLAPILRYFDWLESAMHELSGLNRPLCRTVAANRQHGRQYQRQLTTTV